MTEEENPVLKAMEAYRRARPHRSDELDAAFERYQDSEAAPLPAAGESDPDAASEQPEPWWQR